MINARLVTVLVVALALVFFAVKAQLVDQSKVDPYFSEHSADWELSSVTQYLDGGTIEIELRTASGSVYPIYVDQSLDGQSRGAVYRGTFSAEDDDAVALDDYPHTKYAVSDLLLLRSPTAFDEQWMEALVYDFIWAVGNYRQKLVAKWRLIWI